jgi:hypothetical protein
MLIIIDGSHGMIHFHFKCKNIVLKWGRMKHFIGTLMLAMGYYWLIHSLLTCIFSNSEGVKSIVKIV